jgi:hypothetical protein
MRDLIPPTRLLRWAEQGSLAAVGGAQMRSGGPSLHSGEGQHSASGGVRGGGPVAKPNDPAVAR